MDKKITKEELNAWGYLTDQLVDILNKEYDLEEAIIDIKSFRNTRHYTGLDDEFKKIKLD